MANFPVTNNGYNSFDEYLAVEGTYYTWGNDRNSNTFIWNGAVGNGGQVYPTNYQPYKSSWNTDNCNFIKNLKITTNYPVVIQIPNTFTTSTFSTVYSQVYVKDSIVMPLNILQRIDMGATNFTIVDVPDANPNTINASVNQSGFMVIKSRTDVVNNNLKTYSTTVTITNYSGSSSSGSLVISDSLPTGCKFISASGTGFTLSQTGNSYTMTTSDVIANNGTKTYTLTVQGILPLLITYSFDAISISNDIDYSSRPMVWAGTSITNGTGSTGYRNNYTYLLKNWLKDNLNIHSRVVNKAIGGSNTNHMNDYRLFNNWYDFKQEPKFLFIEHGCNDITSSIPTSTSMLNTTKMINYYRKKYPNCYIMILAPFPLSNATNEAGLVTYRLALQDLIDSYSSEEKAYIKYISATGSVWNPVTQGATYTTDGTHVNDAGRLLIFNAITNYITTNGLTFQ